VLSREAIFRGYYQRVKASTVNVSMKRKLQLYFLPYCGVHPSETASWTRRSESKFSRSGTIWQRRV